MEMGIQLDPRSSHTLLLMIIQLMLQALATAATTTTQLVTQQHQPLQQQLQQTNDEESRLDVSLNDQLHIVFSGNFLAQFHNCLCSSETLTCKVTSNYNTTRQGFYSVASIVEEKMDAAAQEENLNVKDNTFICERLEFDVSGNITCTRRQALLNNGSDCTENGGCTFFSIDQSYQTCDLICINVIWQNITVEYNSIDNSTTLGKGRCEAVEDTFTKLPDSQVPITLVKLNSSAPSESPVSFKAETTSSATTSLLTQRSSIEDERGKSQQNNKSPLGAIIGAAFGGFGTAVILVAIIAFCSFRRWKRNSAVDTFALDGMKKYVSDGPKQGNRGTPNDMVRPEETSDKTHIYDAEENGQYVVGTDVKSPDEVYENLVNVEALFDKHRLRPLSATDQRVSGLNNSNSFGDSDNLPVMNNDDTDYVTVDDLKEFKRINSVEASATNIPQNRLSEVGRETRMAQNMPRLSEAGRETRMAQNMPRLSEAGRETRMAQNMPRPTTFAAASNHGSLIQEIQRKWNPSHADQVGFQNESRIPVFSKESSLETNEPRDISDSDNTYFILEENFVQEDEMAGLVDTGSGNSEEEEINNVYLDLEPDSKDPVYYKFRESFD